MRAERPTSDADDEEGEPVAGVVMPAGRRVRARKRRSQPRKQTIAVRRISRAELRIGALMYPIVDVERPLTRGECVDGPRPCPLVGCKHHLYLDVSPTTGAITLNFPHLEVEELRETCALDVADRGEHTLEQVGELTNLTRERIRQVEVRAFLQLKGEPVIADAEAGG